MPPQNVRKSGIQFDLVFVKILVQLLCPQNLCNSDQLIVIVMSMEERLLPEDHGRQHAPQRPHVQRVVVHLVVDKKLRAFKIS